MKLNILNSVLDLKNLDSAFQQLDKDIKDNNVLCLTSLSSERFHIASALDKKVIYVCKDSYSAQQAYTAFKAYVRDEVVLYQPNDDLLLYRKSFQKSFVGERVKTLYNFATNKAKILVTSAISLTHFVANKDRLIKCIQPICVGQEIDMYLFLDTLASLGYMREDACEEKNTFAVHGDIVDVFLSNMDMPIRISFFGDTIESIKTFDVDTMLSTTSLNDIILYPNNDLLFTKDEIENACLEVNKNISKLNVEAGVRAKQIVDDLSINSVCSQQMQWLIPFIKTKKNTILDYLDDGVCVFEDLTSCSNLIKNYRLEHESRLKDFIKSGESMHAHLRSILTDQEVCEDLKKVKLLAFTNIVCSSPLATFSSIVNIKSKKVNSYVLRYDVLKEDLLRYLKCQDIVYICQATKEKALNLQKSLEEDEIPCKFVEEKQYKFGIYIIQEEILEGFIYPESRLVVIGSENIQKKNTMKLAKSSKNVFVMPQVGDYVVHDFHGIGKCLGLKKIKNNQTERDYIVVEYKNGGLLYLPTEQIDKLSRYSGSETAPKLSSLGGVDFARVKERVKNSLKALAIDLVSLYSARQNLQGFRYQEDDWMMKNFEDAFEFEPTVDQQNAILDIKQDMQKGLVMDRLLCGDVGYGKTEVALRAIFKTILNGKQAAILAPTTILAQQHFRTAKERMGQFGVEIELISRLKTKKEISKSLENIRLGKSQLVVATHRLLSKDVQFHDLGLLVLDEEQRFGVAHKEKLKVLKKNLNVLSLSATPIPRTLNMSLIGIRDISVLETPPSNRIAVQTSVTELTDMLLEDTIKRELSRGGQVFILHNDIATIDRFANDIQNLVSEAKVIYAHGQMDKKILEDRMEKFYSKEANVLVCTTIIENGIDIPDANTLIVCDADKLGLSQLYQLRGRVGRSNRLAYAYFTVQAGKVLTQDALKRLNAIMDYTELGSGFKIAMRDLEIRGAGNILGSEQHGHIEDVGYDMYCKLLQECVGEIKGDVKKNKNCKIDADVNAYLDKAYVNEDNARIKIFRDILDVTNEEEKTLLLQRLEDSFGPVPEGLYNLIDIGFVKNLAVDLNIEIVKIKNQGMGVVFSGIDAFSNDKLMATIEEYKDRVVLTNEEKPQLVFNTKNLSNVDKLKQLRDFLLKATF